MKLNYAKIRFLLIIILVLPFVIHSQNSESLWTKISKNQASSGDLLFRKSEPVKAMYYELNVSALKGILNNSPERRSNQVSNAIVSFPNAEGNFETFRILEASVLHPDLQERHQNIRSYVGQGIENPANLIRFSITPQGLHTLKFSAQGGIEIIDPYSSNRNSYIAYKKGDLPWDNEGFECGFVNQIPDSLSDLGDLSQRNADDGNLREYRLAIASTIEYSEFHWTAAGLTSGDTEAAKKAAVLAEMVVLMTRVNGIYERDLSITMMLVVNNEDIIFIDSDNFSNSSAGALIDESQTEIDAIIGSANYDIGHTVSTGGGGLAQLGAVCGGSKARGITGLTSPVGDVFYVDFVSHEMGHQFGANHSFNGSEGNCSGGNRNSSTAYEPGSGNTVMGYAGICGSQDVQPTSDAFFHQVSLFEIWNFVSTGGGSSCPVITPTGNLTPTAEAGASYTIPISTPYMLVGSSTDGDGPSTHTYTWEEYDLGPAGVPAETTTTGPMVRTYEGTSNPVRYIPRLTDIIANGGVSTTWEVLPSVSRDMDFKLTVRDNDSRGGQNAVDDMTVTTSDTAGPFVVTSQTTNETWDAGSTQTITWDVAGTDVGAVNTPNVDVLLSTDGGLTFPFTVATGIPNSGSESITVPVTGGDTTTARLMVIGSGNIFFSLNTTNFTIEESEFVLSVVDPVMDVCKPDDATYNFTYNTFLGFTDPTTFSTTGLPVGATAVFSPATATADATAVTVTISGTGSLAVGNYPFNLVGTSGAIIKSAAVELNVFDTTFATLNLTAPADGATDVFADNAMFSWDADANAMSYEIDIAIDAGFTTIVELGTPSSNSYMTTSLISVTPYFWRVRSVNDCGTGGYSTAGFTTANISCNSFASTDTPVAIPDNNIDGYNSVLNLGSTSIITDVNITVNITHTWVNDLILTLTSPNGTSVILSNRNGAAATQNYTNTVFDQEAADPISTGIAPFTGSFQPDEDLSVLYGEISGGDWTLNVSDNAFLDTGTIESWSIEICGIPQPDSDGDSIPNDDDNCPDTANADQADNDGDGLGDVCDDDMDGDGILNVDDNCPETANADQTDADGNGIGDLCDTECDIFTSNDTPIDISATEGGTYTAIINIQDDLPIDDVNVLINIDHTWVSDINISLQSPAGTIVDLSSGNGANGVNYTDTVFDDDGASLITGGAAPFSDTYQPEGTLATINGESSLGDWALVVTDTFGPLDGGILNRFELELCVVGEFTDDTDGDGVIDTVDNCVDTANNDQADNDGDGLGDVCDDDIDGDGIANAEDNCPENANPDQGDLNGNGIGDFCDIECQVAISGDTPVAISDGAGNTYSVSVMIMDPITITDVNVTINIAHTFVSDLLVGLISPNGTAVLLTNGNGGSGDNYINTVFDQDADDPITSGIAPFTGSFVPEEDLSAFNGEQAPGEWTLVVIDNFFLDGGSIDLFELEICGLRDPYDYDADGVLNDLDNCVFTANPDQADIDNDGIGDICDNDDDNDGVLDTSDNCQFIANADQADIDMDGIGDPCDPDIDNDTVLNEEDNCPETPNENQSDVDRNGIGDVCDGLIVNDVLTPNSDGYNDTWEIINIERFSDAKIHVYNRWGNQVFSSSDYNNNWNGTSGSSGNALPAGSYFYQIDQNADGRVILTGWIYITY